MGADQSKADEIEERLINFAVRIIKLSSVLPKTPAGKGMLRDKSYAQVLHQLLIMVKQEELRVVLTLYISWALFSKN